MPAKIVHSFPQLGTVTVPLYAESEQTYLLLEDFTSASTQHLRNLDHLGELRGVLNCGIHSRYEYAVLQLYLIHFLKQKTKGYGLSTAISLPSGTEVSSCEELLKSWVFLDELGHLRGTYEAERFLLGILVADDTCRRLFLEAFEDPRGANFARSVIESEDLWNLHRCIAWLSLEYHQRQKFPAKRAEIGAQMDLLHGLIDNNEASRALERARRYFQVIRRLAHIYLDTSNLPAVMHFHPSMLLERLSEDPGAFLDSEEEIFDRLFGSISDYLQASMYSSIEANQYKLQRYQGLLSKFEKRRGDEDRSPLASQQHFLTWLFAAKGMPFWGYQAPARPWKHALRLALVTDGYFEPERIPVVTVENGFANRVAVDCWSLFITSYTSPRGHSLFIDLFERESDDRREIGRVLLVLCRLMDLCYEATSSLPSVLNWLCQDKLVELIRFVLRRCFSGNNSFRVSKHVQFGEYSAVILKTRAERTRWSRSVAWTQKKNGLPKERNWEIDCLRKAVRAAPNGTVICLSCPVVVEDKSNGTSVAEFDGVFIRVHGGRTDLTLVEAKTGQR